ncbi:MAG: GerMN domain-containing protein [Candidatus Margulisiibacteriota bacterium]
MAGRKKKKLKWFFVAVLFTVVAGVSAFMFFTAEKQPSKVSIYFFKNDLFAPVVRAVPQKANPLFFAAEELLRGPSDKERKSGYFTEIPIGTKLRHIHRQKDTVIADFSKELEEYGGGAARVQGLLAQIVYTLTDISGAKNVQILVEGRTEAALGGEGYIIDKPLTKKDTGF